MSAPGMAPDAGQPTEGVIDAPQYTPGATISPFRQDPLSRLYVRVSTALAILEDGSYGLLKFEDSIRLLIMAVGDIDELKLAKGEKTQVGLDWNEHAAVVAANE